MIKKGFFVFAVIAIMVMSACGSISSVQGGTIIYPQPILVNETTTFKGSALTYEGARDSAIKKASSSGYTKIIAENIEKQSGTGLVDVTLIMTK